MEILDNGRLIVDGGNGTAGGQRRQGGGAGGIIQIISPVGKLATDSLSLGHGTRTGKGCVNQESEAHGYYCLQGISILWSLMRLDNFLVSSRAISEPGYFQTNIEGDTVIR